jgi:hypothetical protein
LALTAVPEYTPSASSNDAIKKQIKHLGLSIFIHKTAPPQIVSNRWFPPETLFPITDPDIACCAVDLIKLEGEGTSSTPFQSPGDPAHFYKFGEIVAGREVIKTPCGFAYDGPPSCLIPPAYSPAAELQDCPICRRHAGPHPL